MSVCGSRSGTTQFIDTFEFDDLDRQTKLTRDAVNWGHDLRAEFTYKKDGQFDQIKRFNVLTGGTAFVTSHYGYDGMGRLTSLDHKNSSSTSITGYGWTYDTAGRMKSMDFTNSTYNTEDVTTFGYDRTHQLTSGERSGTTNDEAYAYDGTGNRTTANGATYTTTTNNRLTNDGTFTYTYDDEGNRLSRVRISGAAADDKTVDYTWDYRNRLEKVTFKRNDGTVTKTVDLVYDFANRLARKDVDPDGATGGAAIQTDHYLWDGYELVGISGYNSLVFASGPAPDMMLFESATTLHALLGDHLNTVRDVISSSGTLENHLAYNSYGELKSQTGGAYSPFHRFTGKPFDVAVGLQYNVNRWYDPATGRWISQAPIGFGGGHANLNVYTGNSPVTGIDPYGLNPIDGDLAQTYLRRKTLDTRGMPYTPPYGSPIDGPGLTDWPYDRPAPQPQPPALPPVVQERPQIGTPWWEDTGFYPPRYEDPSLPPHPQREWPYFEPPYGLPPSPPPPTGGSSQPPLPPNAPLPPQPKWVPRDHRYPFREPYGQPPPRNGHGRPYFPPPE